MTPITPLLLIWIHTFEHSFISLTQFHYQFTYYFRGHPVQCCGLVNMVNQLDKACILSSTENIKKLVRLGKVEALYQSIF